MIPFFSPHLSRYFAHYNTSKRLKKGRCPHEQQPLQIGFRQIFICYHAALPNLASLREVSHPEIPGNGMAYASLNDGGGAQPDRRGPAEKAWLWRAQGRIRQEEDS